MGYAYVKFDWSRLDILKWHLRSFFRRLKPGRRRGKGAEVKDIYDHDYFKK